MSERERVIREKYFEAKERRRSAIQRLQHLVDTFEKTDTLQLHDAIVDLDCAIREECGLAPTDGQPTEIRREITSLPPEAWKGTPPAEGTRRALIRDAASNILHSPTLGQGSCDEVALCIADEVEAALLGSGDDEREADAQEPIHAVGEALDRIDAPQGATYAERIDRLYSEVRRDAIDAGNEFDRISIPRSTGATGEPGTPRTLTLAERAAICIRGVLTEEEAKRQLEAEVERLLGGREEARSGESRFAEERDCAFALLRWLLPVVVAKRLDCFEAEEETDA